MAAIDIVNRVFREFKRYTGDGLPNEPAGAPLPVGDPSSDVHNPKKSELREALLAPLGETTADADRAEVARAGAEAAAASVVVGLPKATVAALANINLAAPGANIDGRAMVAGDTFLATAQTAAAANGLYVWNGAAAAATRASVASTFDKIAGQYFSVTEGTANADTLWRCTSNLGGTLGTTALVFDKFTAGGGAVSFIAPPALRLTLTSGVAVMAAGVAGAVTVYATPFAGNAVPLYDGAAMQMVAFTEVSLVTTDATKSPAAVAASKVYDVFAWDDGGTKRISRGAAWTNDTTRGYTLTNIGGVLVNTSAITNGPAAQRGTWLGTIVSNASSTIDFTFGGTGSGGVAANLMICNAYNRVPVVARVDDTGAGYSYASATIRQARASAGNQINFVQASGDTPVDVNYCTVTAGAATANDAPAIGVGLNSKTVMALPFSCVMNSGGAAVATKALTNGGPLRPGLGVNYVAALEYSATAVADLFNSSNNNALVATIWL